MFSDPGGIAPLGFARIGERQLLAPVEGPALDLVRRAFDLYATGTRSDTTLADELGLTEAGLAEILTNPLFAGRVIRHKGKPDEEERPARFAAPVDPNLFEQVQAIRAERRTRHPGVTTHRSYPLVRLMRCVKCGSGYHGDANRNLRRIRHAQRPVCGPSATYRAERFEDQIADLFDRVQLSDRDVSRVLDVLRGRSVTAPAAVTAIDVEARRSELQAQLKNEEITIAAFRRAWRGLNRAPAASPPAVDETRLAHARKVLSEIGTLWRNQAIDGRLREEALREVVSAVDIDGPRIVAVHPQPNENAWLLAVVAQREAPLQAQQCVGVVGARGVAPP